MNPAIHEAQAATLRGDRERAARCRHECIERGTPIRRPAARERLGRALVAAGSRLAH